MYDNVELENMTIQDLKVCVSDVIGEYDSLYYITEDGIKLVNNDSIGELVDRSKLSENIATLYVYHVTPPNVDSDNDVGIDAEIFHSYSDAEFEEIRRTSMIERKKMDELENEIFSGEEFDDSLHESDLDKYTSEECDDEVCYATPPDSYDSYKGKRVVKTFNENIQAKDIQWKQKGLDKAIRELLPFVEHRFCSRHLLSNLKKINASDVVGNCFWNACISTHPQQFKSAMRSLEKLSKPAWEKMKQLDPEIHDMLMMRIHQNRDAMVRRNCIIVPRQKQILDEAIKASAGMRALWDGRGKYVVKGNVTTIQESRQHPVEFVAHWFTKETYMKTYSNYIEVIRGEEFWDDVLGDTILPPVIVKKLKGRPKKQRRKERWEGGSVSHGKYKRMSYCGRVMHCGGRPKKAQVIEPDETQIEVELQSKEAATGEASLMDEMLQQMEEEAHAQES
ncbi:hypothetical protein POM88_047207 [Heracleum sosnowskyi]|uniref:Uncharacterized protein n=1 Tax=Heracleum sosnowskyi TaxID=360622 RepID=A0AAD8GTU7_9APIA|nr:hypothetical protein POM88_047207 [Heracleum sosnowskyi]